MKTQLKNQIIDLLGSTFKSWSDLTILSLTDGLLSDFCRRYQGNYDVLISSTSDAIIGAKKNKEEIDIHPGYIRVAAWNNVGNMMRQFSGNSLDQDLETIFNEERIDVLADSFPSIIEDHSADRIKSYANSILSSGMLTGSEEHLFKIIIKVANDDIWGFEANEEFKKWKGKAFWLEVKKEVAAAEIIISENNLRQLKARLLAKLKTNLSSSTDFLHFASNEAVEDRENILSLEASLNSYFASIRPLKAHRFTENDILGAHEIISIFKNHGFTLSPNSLPEVYCDDLKNAIQIFPHVEHTKNDNTPDHLGIYTYLLKDDEDMANEELFQCAESYEGVIVLFEDRIKNWCNGNQTFRESDVKLVVLMHELGHWLTHWAYSKIDDKNLANWEIGFNRNITHTKEAFAQLIAYWACEKLGEKYTDILLKLTPKIGIEIDISNPYGQYGSLIATSKFDILKKLEGIRTYFFIKDDKMIEFLNAEENDITKWFESFSLDPKLLAEEMIDTDIIESFIESTGCGRPDRLAKTRLCHSVFRELIPSDICKATSLLDRFGCFDS
jgi:hypothetical protein